ncbi:citrulline utilization hydrolase CtlX [Labilibacter marinus]|uniref:citrulline utilization hydrolase CtlX n=1 Tax=Labilibacter marinus TaxID=1477105 RepID=UPI0009500DA3|nr:arginine deiminase-related protein [Labilibacter marinus]
MIQSTSNIFLVRPANFGFNAETAVSNAFQNKTELSQDDLKQRVIAEFDAFAEHLKLKGINVMVVQDTDEPKKPDAIFPNNWGSFHANGKAILYPMATPNRQAEKRPEILNQIKEQFEISELIDLSEYEKQHKFLEGTGSIIFDHINKLAYACISPRTDKDVLNELCNKIGYKPIAFTSTDKNGQEIYHTNVMMCVSEKFSVICLESIIDEEEKKLVINSLESTGHEIIDISLDQVNHFAGNMLSLKNKDQKEILVMSQSAYNILSDYQKLALDTYCEPCPIPIDTIETIGGGSARCMISEIFLPQK